MKNKVIRTIIAVTMALTVVLFCMPMSLAAETNGKCGENLSWNFDDSTGTLTISGEGELALYTINDDGDIVGENPFEGLYDEIKTVEFSEGVTHIGQYSFYECENMTKAIIPDSVKAIGDNAFAHCNSLKTVTVPAIEDFGWAVFANCENLKNVIFKEGTDCIPMATFKGCMNLGWVYVPRSVTYIDCSAFEESGGMHLAYAGTEEEFGRIEMDNLYENVVDAMYDVDIAQNIVFAEDGTIEDVVDNTVENYSGGISLRTIIIIAVAVAVVIAVTVIAVVMLKKKNKNREYKTK